MSVPDGDTRTSSAEVAGGLRGPDPGNGAGSDGGEPDSALLLLVAAGDLGRPLELLYSRFERRLFSLGIHLLGNRGLAEELVQETFIRVWRAASRFDPSRGNASAFVFAIARNIAVDLYRRPSSRPSDQLPDDGSIADTVNELIEGLTVRQALESLSPAHREVVEAVYGRGERAVEVGVRLGIPAATVRTRSFHGLRALERALTQLGFEAD